eukprot:Rhum_TRINITY_DN18491_c0_g1::Rhum_TRINITY_DN18491_c0_g1_i1::g.167449::m.167449
MGCRYWCFFFDCLLPLRVKGWNPRTILQSLSFWCFERALIFLCVFIALAGRGSVQVLEGSLLVGLHLGLAPAPPAVVTALHLVVGLTGLASVVVEVGDREHEEEEAAEGVEDEHGQVAVGDHTRALGDRPRVALRERLVELRGVQEVRRSVEERGGQEHEQDDQLRRAAVPPPLDQEGKRHETDGARRQTHLEVQLGPRARSEAVTDAVRLVAREDVHVPRGGAVDLHDRGLHVTGLEQVAGHLRDRQHQHGNVQDRDEEDGAGVQTLLLLVRLGESDPLLVVRHEDDLLPLVLGGVVHLAPGDRAGEGLVQHEEGHEVADDSGDNVEDNGRPEAVEDADVLADLHVRDGVLALLSLAGPVQVVQVLAERHGVKDGRDEQKHEDELVLVSRRVRRRDQRVRSRPQTEDGRGPPRGVVVPAARHRDVRVQVEGHPPGVGAVPLVKGQHHAHDVEHEERPDGRRRPTGVLEALPSLNALVLELLNGLLNVGVLLVLVEVAAVTHGRVLILEGQTVLIAVLLSAHCAVLLQ